ESVRAQWRPGVWPEVARRVPTILCLIDKCRALAVPVIFTAIAASHRNLDRPSSGAKMPNRFPGISHDPEWFRNGMICDELAPAENEVVIHKGSYGAFFDTPLETILKNLN